MMRIEGVLKVACADAEELSVPIIDVRIFFFKK